MISRKHKISAGKFPADRVRVLRTPFCVMKKRENGLTHARIAVVIGGSVFRSAIRRNRWRRRAYDTIFRHAPAGYDILCIATSGLRAIEPSVFEKEIKNIFHADS